MANIWIEDNKVFVKYKDYSEYIMLGKINGAKWDNSQKVWVIENIETSIKEIENFLFLNQGLIIGADSVLKAISAYKANNKSIQIKKNRIYVPRQVIDAKDSNIAALFSIFDHNTEDYYVFYNDIATRLILAKYYNLDVPIHTTERAKLEIDKYMPEFLFSYQVDGVNFVLNRYQAGYAGVLIADEMGLGKTVQALSVYHVLSKNIPNMKLVVIATKSTMRNAWENDMLKFFNQKAVIANTDDLRNGILTKSSLPVITNYEALSYVYREGYKFEQLDENYILILDEATKMKNTTTSIYNAIDSIRGNAFVIALTGTPLENNLLEFHAIMSIIQPNF